MKHPAKIAVEATVWHNQRGYGRHARALLTALVRVDYENRYTFLVDAEPDLIGTTGLAPNGATGLAPSGATGLAPSGATGNVPCYPQGVEVRQVKTSLPAIQAASAQGNRSFSDMWRMSRALSEPHFDLVLFPTIYSFVPVLSHARKIVFIHDVIADRFSQYTFPTHKARFFWNLKVLAGRLQADAIVTVSEYSKQNICEHFRLDPQKVFVVGEASDPIFRPLDDPALTPMLHNVGIPDSGSLITYVGGFGPHKNLQSLIRAFSALANQQPDIYLILVGEKQETFYSEIKNLEAMAQESIARKRILFTGYLPDEELVILLNCATMLVLPSFMEGFGLPAVEAAACGCPVIATKESPLPGILGEGGLYIDPYQPEQLIVAMKQILSSPELRKRMRENGLRQAGKLTWEHAAQQLKVVIDEILTPDAE
jgi:glycosyltransferase involved in cell wall biosynthesis